MYLQVRAWEERERERGGGGNTHVPSLASQGGTRWGVAMGAGIWRARE
jgi:hypothetical protein